jgi:hypothetical protein
MSHYRRLLWVELADLLDAETVQKSGDYLASVLRSQYDPLAVAETKPEELTPAITLAVKVAAADWIRYCTDLAYVAPATSALCWLLQHTPQHPAFAHMPLEREQIAVALRHIGDSIYSWRFLPSANYGCVLVGINKHATKPDNPYEFDSYAVDPEDLVAPKKALQSYIPDRALTLRTCAISVFENALRSVCLVHDKPFARVTSYHADAIRKTVQRLLSFVRSLPQQPAI